VFFAVVAVALCVLWVRSYWRADIFSAHISQLLCAKGFSANGRIRGMVVDEQNSRGADPSYVHLDSRSSYRLKKPPWHCERHDGFTFEFIIPHWFPVLLAIAVVGVPWFRLRRFSLRTLLIATTLVAVVLGLGVWATR
jgi:hypothetical protein